MRLRCPLQNEGASQHPVLELSSQGYSGSTAKNVAQPYCERHELTHHILLKSVHSASAYSNIVYVRLLPSLLQMQPSSNGPSQCSICNQAFQIEIRRFAKAGLQCSQPAHHARHNPLTLLSASLSDLCGETGLDGSDGAAGSARVAGNKVQSVLSLVELGIWRSAGFASDIFHC